MSNNVNAVPPLRPYQSMCRYSKPYLLSREINGLEYLFQRLILPIQLKGQPIFMTYTLIILFHLINPLFTFSSAIFVF